MQNDMMYRLAAKICNATQKTNFACKEIKCDKRGDCAYCLVMAEDLLKNDVIVLPCKVGDTVWVVGEIRGVFEDKVRTLFCGHPSHYYGESTMGVQMIRTTSCDIPFSDFGKTVFLTREEAEQALRERENNEQ